MAGRQREVQITQPAPGNMELAMFVDFRLRFETTGMGNLRWFATANHRDTRTAALAACTDVGAR